MNKVKVGKTATVTVAWNKDGKLVNTGKAETHWRSMNKAVVTVEAAANKPHAANVHGVSGGLATVEATIDLGGDQPARSIIPVLVIGEPAPVQGFSGATTMTGGEPDFPPAVEEAPHAKKK